MNNQVKVLQNKDKPVSTHVLAQSITAISDGIKKLRSEGLNDRALEVLLQDSSGVNRTDVRKVLSALAALSTNYVRK